MKIKNILLKGAYGQPNFGDDILMMILNNYLKSNDYNFKILVPFKAKYIESLVLLKNIQYYVDHQLDADFLIYGGGTQFYSFPKTKMNSRLLLVRSFYENPKEFFSYLKNRKKRISLNVNADKTMALGIGLGPFNGPNSFNAKKNALSKLRDMKYIMVRDKWSHSILQSNNILSTLANDLCFAPQNYLPFEIKDRVKQRKIKSITFILRDWPHTNDNIHIEKCIRFIKKHEGKNKYKFKKIVLFANDSNCERLLLKEKIEYIKWDPYTSNIQDFIDIIYDTDLVISSRYHGIILSAISKTLFIPIEVDPKLSLFTEDIYNQKIGWKFPYNDLDLSKEIEKLTKYSTEYLSNADIKIEEYRQLMKSTLLEVDSLLNE